MSTISIPILLLTISPINRILVLSISPIGVFCTRGRGTHTILVCLTIQVDFHCVATVVAHPNVVRGIGATVVPQGLALAYLHGQVVGR